MNRNHQGDKNPQNRTGLDNGSQTRQGAGRQSSDVSQSSQGASRGNSQQGLRQGDENRSSSQSMRGSDQRNA